MHYDFCSVPKALPQEEFRPSKGMRDALLHADIRSFTGTVGKHEGRFAFYGDAWICPNRSDIQHFDCYRSHRNYNHRKLPGLRIFAQEAAAMGSLRRRACHRLPLRVFIERYIYDNGFRSYDELFGIAYAWVDWLEYNLRRAMGMEGSDEAEIRLGEEEVRNTIGRIRYLRSIENDVRKTLGNLPPPDPKKYKTHDDSLCYIDLVFEGELTDLPEYALPEGYRFVHYRDGDKKDWIEIELSSEEVLSREHGEASWARYYGGREKELPERMFFIEDASGEKVATATAFYDIHKEPEKESLRKDRFGWKMVALLTGREMLP